MKGACTCVGLGPKEHTGGSADSDGKAKQLPPSGPLPTTHSLAWGLLNY